MRFVAEQLTPPKTIQPSLVAERANIEQQTAEFLARGGEIDRQPILVREAKVKYKPGDTDAQRKQRSNAGSTAAARASRTGSTLWLNQAARHCNVLPLHIQAAVDRKELKAEFSPHARRLRFQIAELDRWMRQREVTA